MSEVKSGASALMGVPARTNQSILNQPGLDTPKYQVNAKTEAVRKYLEELYDRGRYEGRPVERKTLTDALDNFFATVAKTQTLKDLLDGKTALVGTSVDTTQLPQAMSEFMGNIPLSLLDPKVETEVQNCLGDKAPENMNQLSLRELSRYGNVRGLVPQLKAEQSLMLASLAAGAASTSGASFSFKNEVADGVIVKGKANVGPGDAFEGEIKVTGKVTGCTEVFGAGRYTLSAPEPLGGSVGVRTCAGRVGVTVEQTLGNSNKTKVKIPVELAEGHNLELKLEKDHDNGGKVVGVTYEGGGEGNVQGAVGVKHITGDNPVTRIHFGVKGKF